VTDSAPTPYTPDSAASRLRAPEGTDPSTLWIWLIVVIPIVQSIPLFFIDWGAFVEATLADPTGMGAYGIFFSPAYLAVTALGWIGVGLQIWFAYLDWRELGRRGVPKPFHWAFIFLVFAVGSIVYVIGRSVVVKSRTGGGTAPMWVAIATYAAGIIAGIWITVVITQMIFDAVMMMPFGP
jgi:hypothetical protein